MATRWGRSVDLSQWYGDAKKKKVSARGIIDILKRYNFTIEENTPLDQEVSLDPELLGKAFENLLASYNPETKTSARKQTGSFYTPREIVQYMVDESLVAHLKRTCGDEMETEYRRLLSYATDETTLTEEQRQQVMHALYNCRVLDPACGSGAFPMGVLQQMVHILRQLDPTNEMWKEFMVDLAIEQSRVAFSADAEEERKARLADIEEAFNRNINDPDYARKLYLIEHCIYGVDIQPIAVQISKLRFFISLVVDQKPTTDATQNFGIRPLPNLESKFVAANTLIPIEYDATLVDSNPEVRQNKDRLKELNHKCFLVKRKVEKDRLKRSIKETRVALAQAIEDTGFVGHSEAELLAGWDMFDQNASSSYFDAEWMFGVKGGFDVVIGNPPYVLIGKDVFKILYEKFYKYQEGKIDLYRLFIEKGLYLCSEKGCLSFITPNTFLSIKNCAKLRRFIIDKNSIEFIDNYDESVFEASVNSIVFLLLKDSVTDAIAVHLHSAQGTSSVQLDTTRIKSTSLYEIPINADNAAFFIKEKMQKDSSLLNDVDGIEMCLGAQPYHNSIHTAEEMKSKFLHSDYRVNDNYVRDYGGKHFSKYVINKLPSKWIDYGAEFYTKPARRFFDGPRIVIREIPSNTLICAYIETFALFNKSVFNIRSYSSRTNLKYILAILNSKAVGYYIASFGDKSNQTLFPRVSMKMLKQIPIPSVIQEKQNTIIDLVNNILKAKEADPAADTKDLEDKIDLLVYHLYGLTYDEVLIIDPETPITREEYNK
ncbi:MAG: Eco57I restriction-modification methylase domain-containing protein [Bacteroidales bacterium]|nr:Eco57I restriction-modification methylase domain-containing protein [Bacteroidales bacterium]